MGRVRGGGEGRAGGAESSLAADHIPDPVTMATLPVKR